MLDALRDGFDMLPGWGQKTLIALLALVIGVLVIRVAERIIDRAMYKSASIDPTLRNFLDSVTNVIGWVILIIVILSIYGVSLSAMLGGLAIGGFVLGFALKDTLSNLAAGVLLLGTRPYAVRDTVTISGETGDVIDLGISLTTLKAGDGRIITIPNGTILRGTVINHTRNHTRRADVQVGIGYQDDIDVAVKAILEAVADDARVLSDPAPSVRIGALGPDAVELTVRPWVATGDFWEAKADLHGTVRDALRNAGIDIPYAQRVVHQA